VKRFHCTRHIIIRKEWARRNDGTTLKSRTAWTLRVAAPEAFYDEVSNLKELTLHPRAALGTGPTCQANRNKAALMNVMNSIFLF